jgi:hypothetical protein
MRLNSVTKFPRAVQIIEQSCIIIGTILLVETIALTWWNNPSTWDLQSFAIDTLAPILVLDTWFVIFINWCWRTIGLLATWLTITWAFWAFLWAMCVFSFATFERTWLFCECKLSIYLDSWPTSKFHVPNDIGVSLSEKGASSCWKIEQSATITCNNPCSKPHTECNNPCSKPQT